MLFITTYSQVKASCQDWFDFGFKTNGIYAINPDGGGTFKVYCEMDEADGKGWFLL